MTSSNEVRRRCNGVVQRIVIESGERPMDGVLAALDVIRKATGEKEVNAIGYCVGGTLLAVTLAYLAARGENGIASATFFTTQVDFTHAGDLKVFADEEQIANDYSAPSLMNP